MARPEKCKRICTLPEKNRFICEDSDSSADTQTVSVEEFETIRLIDYIGLTQEQCASQMHVARTTVQRLYTDANYQICENSETCCKLAYCPKKSCECDCGFRVEGCVISTLDKNKAAGHM